MTITPVFGDRVRVRTGATGRYLQDGLAMVISMQDNEPLIDEVADGFPHPSLPVPTDGELLAACEGLRYARHIRSAVVAKGCPGCGRMSHGFACVHEPQCPHGCCGGPRAAGGSS